MHSTRHHALSTGLPPITQLGQDVVIAALTEDGLMSHDVLRQKEAVGRYLHPDVTFSDHLARTDGRWNVWKLLRGVTAMFDIAFEVKHAPVVDHGGLRAVVWFDEVFKPRLPLHLHKYLFVQRRAPVVAYTVWQRQQDGSLLITDLELVHSTAYLPSLLLGPLGEWLQTHAVQPFGRVMFEAVTEVTSFITACGVLLRKQLFNTPASWSGNRDLIRQCGQLHPAPVTGMT